ncbi:hypothetical protein VTI74DRAFT_2285 [Chaetomium olivicolor]
MFTSCIGGHISERLIGLARITIVDKTTRPSGRPPRKGGSRPQTGDWSVVTQKHMDQAIRIRDGVIWESYRGPVVYRCGSITLPPAFGTTHRSGKHALRSEGGGMHTR